MARNSRGRSSSGVAVSFTKLSGIACGANTLRALFSASSRPSGSVIGVGKQRADHRRGHDPVVPADAAAPGMGHRRQHHQTRDALRIIERHPRAERARERMHDDDDRARAEFFQRLLDHPRVQKRASNPSRVRAHSSHGRDDRSGSRDDVARAVSPSGFRIASRLRACAMQQQDRRTRGIARPEFDHIQRRACDIDFFPVRWIEPLEHKNAGCVTNASSASAATMIIGIIEIFRTMRPPYNYVAAAQWFRGKNVEFSRRNAGICHTRVVGHFITMVSTFSDARAHVTQGVVRRPAYHT